MLMVSLCRCLSWTTSRTMTTTKMKRTINAPRSFKAFVYNNGHEDCIRSKQLVLNVISMTICCESPVAWFYFDELHKQEEDCKEAWTWSWLCLSEVPEWSQDNWESTHSHIWVIRTGTLKWCYLNMHDNNIETCPQLRILLWSPYQESQLVFNQR
jgi:hypothetical protein